MEFIKDENNKNDKLVYYNENDIRELIEKDLNILGYTIMDGEYDIDQSCVKDIITAIEKLEIEKNCKWCIHNVSSDDIMNYGEHIQHCGKNYWDNYTPHQLNILNIETDIARNCRDYERK